MLQVREVVFRLAFGRRKARDVKAEFCGDLLRGIDLPLRSAGPEVYPQVVSNSRAASAACLFLVSHNSTFRAGIDTCTLAARGRLSSFPRKAAAIGPPG